MFGIIGAIPDVQFPLVSETPVLKGEQIFLGQRSVSINRGTPAMIAAGIETLKYMDKPNPYCYLVGDIGDGEGCKRLYQHLTEQLPKRAFNTLSLHYFQPNVELFRKMLRAINKMPSKPALIADAGFMYVAKMAGDAPHFDLFTPDAGELAYLADEQAPHPFYTRGFILHDENRIPDLIKRAYQHNNAAAYLLVKGEKDYIVNKEGLITVVDSPNVEELEPIGGTGDTLTGIVSALIAAGMPIESATFKAAKINRLAGFYASPTPATQVYEIIKQIPRALDEVLQ